MKRPLLRLLRKIQQLELDFGGQPSRERCDALLLTIEAHQRRHLHDRSLYDHLRATEDLLSIWQVPTSVQYAGLFHSYYYDDVITPPELRTEAQALLRSVIGRRAESLVRLYCSTDFSQLLIDDANQIGTSDPDTTIDLLTLFLANELEQAGVPGKAPTPWLGRVSNYVETLRNLSPREFPFALGFPVLSETDESLLLDIYSRGLASLTTDLVQADRCFQHCLSICDCLIEPAILRSYIASLRDDLQSSQAYATLGLSSLSRWGVVWDRRLSRIEWRAIAESLRSQKEPRIIGFMISCLVEPGQMSQASNREPLMAVTSDLSETAQQRILKYLERFANDSGSKDSLIYPRLGRRTARSPKSTLFFQALAASASGVQDEVTSVPDHLFTPWLNTLGTRGAAATLSFFRNGERNLTAFAVCPQIGRVVDGVGDISRNALASLYLLKLGPKTFIAPHKDRADFHMRIIYPIICPSTDCGIHVGGRTELFAKLQPIAIESSGPIEEWNNGEGVCFLLCVDLWRDDISAPERKILDAVHRTSK